MKVPVNQWYSAPRRMEESADSAASSSSASQNHNGGGQPFGGVNVSVANNKHQPGGDENDDGGGGGGGGSGGGGGQGPKKEEKPQYTVPAVLHFLQHEWARFELERSQWELDRAEFQAKIAFLQGERSGQESLKTDLVRRIKMLEYALKQERAKFHKLKYGTDLVIQGDAYEESSTCTGTEGGGGDGEAPFTSVSKRTWMQGRQLLRQYLQEIGYTDTIIDVRSNRVRSLLGLNNNADTEDTNTPALNGNQSAKKVVKKPVYQRGKVSIPQAMLMETEAAVMANFEFLAHTDIDMEDDDNDGDEEIYDSHNTDTKQNKASMLLREDVDAEAEEVLNELNLLTEHEESIIHFDMDATDWNATARRDSQADQRRATTGEEGGIRSLGLGELAQLTVNNDAEAAYEQMATNNEESYRKSWNAKYTLRSHFDAVRALAFHPKRPCLITASDDHTLKLWDLQKTVPAKKSASLDVEPSYTFRGHTGPVLCLAMNSEGSHCFSGGLDGKIIYWFLPLDEDLYDSYHPSVLNQKLIGHTDAVWGLSICHTDSQLLSVSADGTVKLWNYSKAVPLKTYTSEQDKNPTSVDFLRDEPHQIVVAYEESIVILDAETGSVVSRLASDETQRVNRLVAHPILPMVIAANEDHHIRFYDSRSATLAHAMVAHLDAITSLAVDPSGLYLLSGSHDCSIRLWNVENKTCIQEITAHRKKFDESILDVAFHPSRPFIASAGADALAKVFV